MKPAGARIADFSEVRVILVPWDLGNLGRPAVEYALEMARHNGARVRVLHVTEEPKGYGLAFTGYVEGPGLIERRRKHAGEELGELARSVDYRVDTLCREGKPVEEILAEADDAGAGLIVMTSHGRTGIGHALIGSVAERVVRRSRVPVIVIPSRFGET